MSTSGSNTAYVGSAHSTRPPVSKNFSKPALYVGGAAMMIECGSSSTSAM